MNPHSNAVRPLNGTVWMRAGMFINCSSDNRLPNFFDYRRVKLQSNIFLTGFCVYNNCFSFAEAKRQWVEWNKVWGQSGFSQKVYEMFLQMLKTRHTLRVEFAFRWGQNREMDTSRSEIGNLKDGRQTGDWLSSLSLCDSHTSFGYRIDRSNLPTIKPFTFVAVAGSHCKLRGDKWRRCTDVYLLNSPSFSYTNFPLFTEHSTV